MRDGGEPPVEKGRAIQSRARRHEEVELRWRALLRLLEADGGDSDARRPREPTHWPFVRVRVDGKCPVAVLWVRRSDINRPSKCLEDTRSELARKGLSHRRMSNDSPEIKWSCQRVNEQVGVGIARQFSGCDGLLD